MKKYFYSVLIMTVFAIGFAASDDTEKSKSSNQMEQTQETEEERQKREEEEKMKEFADMAYKKGWDMRMNTQEIINSATAAHLDYTITYSTLPEEEPDQKRWKIFLKQYEKGFADAAKKLERNLY